MPNEACVYWIRCADHTDMMSQGYVGVTMYFDKRMQQHLQRAENKHLAFAITKYGWDNLVKEKLLIGTPKYCFEIEAKIRPEDKIGWNLTSGGNKPPDGTGRKFTRTTPVWNEGIPCEEEVKKRISQKVKGLWEDPEYRSSMCAKFAGRVSPMKGRKHSKETIEKIRASKVGVPLGGWTPSAKEKQKKIMKIIAMSNPWVCPHCNKSGNGKGTALRWHFDKCKAKPKGAGE